MVSLTICLRWHSLWTAPIIAVPGPKIARTSFLDVPLLCGQGFESSEQNAAESLGK